ncbi:MAG TPA: NapC/NirT family cytochrome c [Actinomycetota bacterium]|nr:NapC/NirT family cytochrome c [Actinomycetota bacterium]
MIFRRRRRNREAGSSDAPEGPGTPPPEPTGEGGGEQDETARKGVLGSARAALAPVRKRHLFIAGMGLMSVVGGGLIVFSAISFWWTSQPSFCGRCHVMTPYIQAWERSSHREVNCERCHLTPGFFGFVGGKIAGLQVVANYIRGDYEDWSFNAAVTNAACLQCHEEILDASIHDPDTGILVSHKDIIETGGKCMFCHSTVAHGSAVATGSATHPTMSTCLTCHNDEIAPLECGLCHVGKKPPGTMPTGSAPAGTG